MKNDPFETNNIASQNPDIIEQMESLLKKYRTDDNVPTDENDEESLKIKEELKKMGYI